MDFVRIKKLYIYIVKTFIPLLLVSSAVALFVVVTQLLWQSMGDLIGKGIDAIIFLKLLFYASMTVMPLAIILGVLVASLMTFGNLGERMELLAMKSAGIPLLRIMKPLFATVLAIAIGLFIFQNDYMIKSQVSFWQYYFSIKNKSPELAIPEGVFYKDLENFSIYVERKDNEAKMMYGMMIYDLTQGFRDATVLVADSGRLYSANNGTILILELYSGESFQNLKDDNTDYRNNADRPFLREKFATKKLHIPFDANLSMMDASILSSQFVGKNVFQLKAFTDSLTIEIDSLTKIERNNILKNDYLQTFVKAGRAQTINADLSYKSKVSRNQEEISSPQPDGAYTLDDTDADTSKKSDQAAEDKVTKQKKDTENHYAKLPKKERLNYDTKTAIENSGMQEISMLYETAILIISDYCNENYYSIQQIDESVNLRRKNEFEYWRKFTYPVACIVFFLIGAPLGALIRKGGMGVPFITAVLFFIVFYVLESFGWKLVREGTLVNWFGMWLPNLALFPVGIWLCYVATKDSTRLSFDTYATWFKRVFGTRTERKIEYKDIVMTDVDLEKAHTDIERIECQIREIGMIGTLSYTDFFLKDNEFGKREQLNSLIEEHVKNLENTRDYLLVLKLAHYPFLKDLSRTMRLKSRIGNILVMLFFPFGGIVYSMYTLRNKKYLRELKNVSKANEIIGEEIKRISTNNSSNTK